jgi:hypothetical protein
MEPDDALLEGAAPLYEGGQVLRKEGEAYAVYLPRATPSGRLDLGKARGPFDKRWYNPRTGAFEGAAETVEAGGVVELGAPPSAPEEDWAILLRKRP